MRDGATFINTGRGAQVVEADMIAVLKARPDLTALLDVTSPEPPPADSELWRLPNVMISPHIGGTTGHEVVRLADCVIEEFEAWQAGKPLRYEVTREIFGGRDHTTVMNADRRIRKDLAERRNVFHQVTELTTRIKQQAKQS